MSTVPLLAPTAQQVRQALTDPDSGRSQYGWDGFQVHWPTTGVGLTTADRIDAQRRTLFVDDLDAAAAHQYRLDPLAHVAYESGLAVLFGPEYISRMRAEFGFLPGAFRSPDSRGPMSYSPHGVIVAFGHFGATAGLEVETWSCSTSHDVVGPDVGAMPNEIPLTNLEDCFGAWSALISAGSGVGFPPHTWLDGVAYYRRKENGDSTTGVWQRYISPTPTQGTVTTAGQEIPYQLSTVVTLDAGGARKGRFGRFFMPGLGTTTLNDQIDVGVAAGAVANAATMLTGLNTALNAATGHTTELVVASAIGSGENRPVRSLRVGRVFDTQRRRRRSVAEDYQVVPFQT